MHGIALTLTLRGAPLALAMMVLGACGGTEDALTNGTSPGGVDPSATAGGADTTFNHSNDPGGAAGQDFQPAEPEQLKIVGSPEVTARMHACGKMSYTSIGKILASRGLTGALPRGLPNGTQGAQQLYTSGAAALGVANYPGRVPEAPFSSTSAMSKLFDIFTMGSYAAVAPGWIAPGCGDTKLLDGAGKFTQDGVSCLLGKPATADYVALANDAIAKNGADGAKIAVAALLSAAHTCQ